MHRTMNGTYSAQVRNILEEDPKKSKENKPRVVRVGYFSKLVKKAKHGV